MQGSNRADLKPDRQRRVLHNRIYQLPLGRSGLTLITSQPHLEEEAKDYIEELETELDEPLELDEFEPPPKPSIELKPLPPGLKYVFLNGDRDSPVIISD